MALFYFDSFGSYADGNNDFSRFYTFYFGSANIRFDVQNDLGDQRCLRLSGGSTFSPKAVNPNPYSVSVGLQIYFGQHPINGSEVFSFHSASGSKQLSIRYRQASSSQFFLEAGTVDSSGSIVSIVSTSRYIKLATWVSMEILVEFSALGRITWRFGSEVSTTKDISTQRDGSGCSEVRVSILGTTQTRIRCLTLSNELLGDVSAVNCPVSSRIALQNEWITAPKELLGTGKVDLVILAGQSNMNGYGSAPLPPSAGVRALNPYVWIWDKPASAFRPLEAGVNSNNQCVYLSGTYIPGSFVGPELTFAEEVARYFEKADIVGPSCVCLVKYAQDGSSLYTNANDYTWDPTQPGNLYNNLNNIAGAGRKSLVEDVTAAVSSLGGWSRVRKVLFFWYQGETDSIYPQMSSEYAARLNYLFERAKLDFLAPIKFHIVLLHARLRPATGPNTYDGAWYKDIIVGAQREVARAQNAGIISVDDLLMEPNLIHLLKSGYEELGRRMAKWWQISRSPQEEVDDDITRNNDGLETFIASKTSGAVQGIHVLPQISTLGSHILAGKLTVYGVTSAGPQTVGLALGELPQDPISWPAPSSSVEILLHQRIIPFPELSEAIESTPIVFTR